MTMKYDNTVLRQWVKRWQQAGVELEHMRCEEICHANTRQAIENLDDAFESALCYHTPSSHSGFEQQQALFHRRLCALKENPGIVARLDKLKSDV